MKTSLALILAIAVIFAAFRVFFVAERPDAHLGVPGHMTGPSLHQAITGWGGTIVESLDGD